MHDLDAHTRARSSTPGAGSSAVYEGVVNNVGATSDFAQTASVQLADKAKLVEHREGICEKLVGAADRDRGHKLNACRQSTLGCCVRSFGTN